MCGLFGFHLEHPHARRATVRTLTGMLMALNDHRGGDSWGFYSPDRDVTRKGLGTSVTMGRADFLLAATCRTLIGHTRYATTGAKTVENAHPFDVGDIVGAHNGVVSNHRDLNRLHGRACEVDSEHLFHHLQEGLDLREIEGYGAVALFARSRPDFGVFLGTFNDGELALVRVPGLGLVWSSSHRHLTVALRTAGVGRWTRIRLEDGALYGLTAEHVVVRVRSLDVARSWWNDHTTGLSFSHLTAKDLDFDGPGRDFVG